MNTLRSLCIASVIVAQTLPLPAAEEPLRKQDVDRSIELARKALLEGRKPDGTWGSSQYPRGVTSLVALALMNSGMKASDPALRKALDYLRDTEEPSLTYEVSLMIMALAMAKDPDDRHRIQRLASQLEGGQVRNGKMKGCWTYHTKPAVLDTSGDRSNGQFAVLGLYEAANAGAVVSRDTWEQAQRHWIAAQNPDGGWGYSGLRQRDSTGSMTVAGIAVMVMTSAMLQKDDDLDASKNPDCCGSREKDEAEIALERGLRWMKNHFAVGVNPSGGGRGEGWLFYYLYGLERAGRLSGLRYFGEHDWYRAGGRFLIRGQNKRTGVWSGDGFTASQPMIGTAFGLLFLSKGLAPVLINKAKFTTAAGDDQEDAWNQHPYDIRNLTNLVTSLERWPKLLTWQVVDMPTLRKHGTVADLLLSPILYISSAEKPEFTDRDVELLRQYVDQGGFILAVNNYRWKNGPAGDHTDRTAMRSDFHDAIHGLVDRMYPDGGIKLERLKANHAIFRSEHNLSKAAETTELWGADFGCRTAIVYSPDDIACLWNRWSRLSPKGRPPVLSGRITKAMKIGTNIIAYATAREFHDKVERQLIASEEGAADGVRRGLLQVAQLRHTGGWDTAPTAARNLLLALNRTYGLTASTRPTSILPTDPELENFGLAVMHGRHRFAMSKEEIDRLREYLLNGRVLFADACCGSSTFDTSFRRFAEQLFPEKELKRIPVTHELFTTETGHDLRTVKRRTKEASVDQTINGNLIETKPHLEGIEVNGRLVVIYSKYDISCALERQASVACAGYTSEDAVRLAVNVVLYSMGQFVTLSSR